MIVDEFGQDNNQREKIRAMSLIELQGYILTENYTYT